MKKLFSIVAITSLLACAAYLVVPKLTPTDSVIEITSRFVGSQEAVIPLSQSDPSEQIFITSRFVETDQGIKVERYVTK